MTGKIASRPMLLSNRKGQIALFQALLLLIPSTMFLAENISDVNESASIIQSIIEQGGGGTVGDFIVQEESPTVAVNDTGNETVADNSTLSDNSTIIPPSNDTSSSNETAGNDTVQPPANESNSTAIFLEPSVDVSYPQKITRRDPIMLTAVVTNPNYVALRNVSLEWALPQGIELVSTEGSCELLEQNSSCTLIAELQTSLSTSLGINEIKVAIKYEK